MEFNKFAACFDILFTEFMKKDMLDMTATFERDMPSVTPRLKDISPKPDGGRSGPSVLLVAWLTVATAAVIITLLLLVSCVLTTVVIYFRRKKQLIA